MHTFEMKKRGFIKKQGGGVHIVKMNKLTSF